VLKRKKKGVIQVVFLEKDGFCRLTET